MPNKTAMTPRRASPGRASMKAWARRQNGRRVISPGATASSPAGASAISASPFCIEARNHGVEKSRDGDRERDVGEHARHIHGFGKMHDAVPQTAQRRDGLAAEDRQQ